MGVPNSQRDVQIPPFLLQKVGIVYLFPIILIQDSSPFDEWTDTSDKDVYLNKEENVDAIEEKEPSDVPLDLDTEIGTIQRIVFLGNL